MNATIYTTPSCPYCVMAKNFLKEHKVNVTEYDVSKDMDKAEEMIRISGQMGVPVIKINGKVIVGFNKSEILRNIV